MLTFTVRPAVNWTISFSAYQKGSIKELHSHTNYASNGITSPHAEGTAGTTYGGTQDFVVGNTYHSLKETRHWESGNAVIQITDRTGTASGAHYYDPSTVRVIIPYNSGPPAEAAQTVTVTNDFTNGGSLTVALTIHNSINIGDTSRASTRGTSNSWQEIHEEPDNSYDTSSPAPTATNPTQPITEYTQSGTSSHVVNENQTAYYKNCTATFSDGEIPYFTTSSTTLATTHTSMPSSRWDTCYSTRTDQPTTRLTDVDDESNAVTYAADITSYYDHMSGTDQVNDTSWVRTDHLFNGLADTVILLNANRGSDFNLSGMIWKFALASLATDASSSGRFTDLFVSVAGNTVTVPEFSKFETVSVEMSGITLSVGTSIYTDETGGTFTYSRTSYNGIYYPTVTSVSTDSTGGTHNYTLPPVMTVSDSRSFGISGVGSTLSTYYTETDHTSPAVSLTLFTHTVQASGYRRSDSSWTEGTETSTWVSATSSAFDRDNRHQPATTTHLVSFRGTTADEILTSKFSVTGTITSTLTDETGGTTGLGTYAVFLGMDKTTTTRVISLERIDTISTYLASLHQDLRIYTSTFESGGTSHLGGSDGTASATYEEPDGSGGTRTQSHQGVDKSFATHIWADEIFLTNYEEHKLGPKIYAKPLNFNCTEANRAVFRALPVGWAGFGGSFEASSLSVFRTTTEGLLAGSTFSTDQKVSIDGWVSAAHRVSMLALHSGIPIGGGAQSASLISIPSVMTSVVSVAATWTSSTATSHSSGGTTSTITSLFATHTIALSDRIEGSFWASEAMTLDNGFRTGLFPDGGFVGSVGFGLGANILEGSYQVILDAGYVEWTEYSGRQSSAGGGASSSGSNGSVSFAVPWSHAIVFRAENLLTAKWERAAQNDNYFFSLPYIPAEPY